MARKPTKTDAVMARRRPRDDNEGLTEQERAWKAVDFYGSPPWAARAGGEVARELFPEARIVREPACGLQSMSQPLGEYFPEVWPSDVYPHTSNTPILDFFDHAAWPDEPDCDLIMTNPPFVTAGDFLRLALKRARLGVGFLCRTVWVESADRYDLFAGDIPMTQLCIFSERVAMQLGPWEPAATSATSYSWFFWRKDAAPIAPRWFGPGTKERLWRPDDAVRFGKLHPMPLFPDVE